MPEQLSRQDEGTDPMGPATCEGCGELVPVGQIYEDEVGNTLCKTCYKKREQFMSEEH